MGESGPCRAARRVRLPGVQVTYEAATAERQQARVVDLSREGLYIPSAKPLYAAQPCRRPEIDPALERLPINLDDLVGGSNRARIGGGGSVGQGEACAGQEVAIAHTHCREFRGVPHALQQRGDRIGRS